MGFSGGGFGMRTIWINLRAMNYTDQAFRQSILNVKDLSKAEKEEYEKANKRLNMSRLETQAGMLNVAMGAMFVKQLFNIMSATREGSQYMAMFNYELNEMKVMFADSLFESLRPFMDILRDFFGLIRANPVIAKMASTLALLTGVVITGAGAYRVLNWTLEQYAAKQAFSKLVDESATLSKLKLTLANHGLNLSLKAVVGTLTAGIAGFAIAYTIFKDLPPVIGVVTGAVLALATAVILLSAALTPARAALSVGLGAASAGALLGAYTSATKDLNKGFANGTISVPSTGLYMLHKGEAVYNPQTNRPSGSSNMNGVNNINQKIEINMSGMTIQTKMDKEEFVPFLRKELRNISLSK